MAEYYPEAAFVQLLLKSSLLIELNLSNYLWLNMPVDD